MLGSTFEAFPGVAAAPAPVAIPPELVSFTLFLIFIFRISQSLCFMWVSFFGVRILFLQVSSDLYVLYA